jgi:hypothetical protein
MLFVVRVCVRCGVTGVLVDSRGWMPLVLFGVWIWLRRLLHKGMTYLGRSYAGMVLQLLMLTLMLMLWKSSWGGRDGPHVCSRHA